jgi:FkbM family methyltransferase
MSNQNFSYEEGYIQRRVAKLRNSTQKFLFKKSLPIFIKAADTISTSILANGSYEIKIKKLIDFYSQGKFSDFFLDLGANIGLTSCQSGKNFKAIHMFEPNPDCLHILKVNCRICLQGVDYQIHEYGLGKRDETLQLFIPKKNWGGAFLSSTDNSLSQDILLRKDHFEEFDETNYLVENVLVKDAEEVFSHLFKELLSKKLVNGVIKIDVEGFESVIFEGLSNTLPSGLNLIIIFENWGDGATVNKSIQSIRHQFKLYQMVTLPYTLKYLPSSINSILSLLFNKREKTVLIEVPEVNAENTFVLELSTNDEIGKFL